MSRRRLFSGIALAAMVAACGDLARDPLGPGGDPSLDGGLVVGGNRSDSTSVGEGDGGAGTTSTADDGGLVVGGNQ